MKNETMNSNSESLFITELSVVAKTEVKTQDLRKHISYIFLMAMRGVRKPKRDNPKIFCKSEKIFRIDIF